MRWRLAIDRRAGLSHNVPLFPEREGQPVAYTKLFNSIITSTIWMEDDPTRIVWVTMLALADKNGEVHGSPPGLARIAGVSVERCRDALYKFLSPDPDSRTKTDEGRRIAEIDGGWVLLNHSKYRAMASRDEKREREATRKAAYRKRAAQYGAECPTHGRECPTGVPSVSANVPVDVYIADTDTTTKAKDQKQHHQPPQAALAGFDAFWAAYPVRKGKAAAEKTWAKRKLGDIADEIIADVTRRKVMDRQWLSGFAPHASTYVNQRGWEDEIDQRSIANNPAPKPSLCERAEAAIRKQWADNGDDGLCLVTDDGAVR